MITTIKLWNKVIGESSLQFASHCLKYARIRVFTDPYSRIFYAMSNAISMAETNNPFHATGLFL